MGSRLCMEGAEKTEAHGERLAQRLQKEMGGEQRRRGQAGREVKVYIHVMVLTQVAEISVKLLDSLLVRLDSFTL
jgi:hypothetical protein